MFLSVVIPVYNAEKYIGTCIDSFLRQTCDDWELILIDDGSIDNSLSICELYAEKAKNIKVFHIENGGPSKARNFGLMHISGEYVSFVDADDWVSDDYVETIKGQSSGCDVVFWGIDICKNGSSVSKIPKPVFSKNNHISEDVLKSLIVDGSIIFFGFNVLKAFKSVFFTQYDLRYRENLKNSEDHVLMLEMLQYVSTIKIIPRSLYRYRILTESLSHSKKRYLDKSHLADVLDEILPRLRDKWNVPYVFYRNRTVLLRIDAFSEIAQFKKDRDALIVESRKIVSYYRMCQDIVKLPKWLKFSIAVDQLCFKGWFLFVVLWIRKLYEDIHSNNAIA